MSSVSLKIAYSIIITGLFIIVVFVAANYEVLAYNFYIVLIPLTAFLFLFGFAMGQRFSLPVKELLKDADYLSKGNVNVRFSSKDQDELGQLAKVFNKIAEGFEKNKSEIETLDTKVRLRTQTLEEIIKVLEQKVKNRTIEFQSALDELEKNKVQLNLKNIEIMDLNKKITELTATPKRKSSKKI
mgnify:FL=1